jgi:hypothetical protein
MATNEKTVLATAADFNLATIAAIVGAGRALPLLKNALQDIKFEQI